MTTTYIVKLIIVFIATILLIVILGVVGVIPNEEGGIVKGITDSVANNIGGIVVALIPVGLFLYSREGVERRIDKIGKKLHEHIRGHKQAINITISNSPIQLNNKGKEILKKSGAKKYLEQYIAEIYKEFKGINEAWEIDEKAFDIIVDESDTEKMKPVKKLTYENAYNYDDVMRAMSIELRNMVLEKKGIPIKQPEREKQHKQ